MSHLPSSPPDKAIRRGSLQRIQGFEAKPNWEHWSGYGHNMRRDRQLPDNAGGPLPATSNCPAFNSGDDQPPIKFLELPKVPDRGRQIEAASFSLPRRSALSCGSFSTKLGCPREVCSTPMNGHAAATSACHFPVSASGVADNKSPPRINRAGFPSRTTNVRPRGAVPDRRIQPRQGCQRCA